MKSLHWTALGWVIAACAGAAGCALVGYDFSDYKSSGAGGSGGSDPTTSQTTGPASTGSGMPSSSTSTGGSTSTSSSGSGGSQPCLTETDCNDSNPCTTDVCSSGQCGHPPIFMDDSNPCTLDGCDPSTGMQTHTPIAGCCPHSICTTGLALNSGTCTFMGAPIDCVAEVCGTTPSCCTSSWDATCVANAKAVCAVNGGISCMCAHSYCLSGPPLTADCDPCVAAICVAQPSCCTVGWGDDCVTATHTACNIPLGPDCK